MSFILGSGRVEWKHSPPHVPLVFPRVRCSFRDYVLHEHAFTQIRCFGQYVQMVPFSMG